MDLKELQDLFKTEFDKFKDICEKQATEIKELGAGRESTGKDVDKLGKSVKEIQDAIDTKIKEAVDTAGADLEEKFKALDDQKAAMKKQAEDMEAAQKRIDEFELKMNRPGFSSDAEIKTPGQAFTESDVFKTMVKQGGVNCSPVNIKSFYKADPLVTSITSGSLAVALRFPQIIAPPERPLRIRDLLTVQPIGTNAIDYVEETGFTINAEPVAEGEEKPKSELSFELKTEAVKTLAHWIPVSRQVLEDVSQIRAYIDQRLMYGLKRVEEDQVLYGNGVAPNLTGIMNNTGIQTYSWSNGTAGDTKIDCIRRAMTLARLAEYELSGIVLAPQDWEDIELLKGDDNHYIWITVTEGGTNRLFRIPVVETTAMTATEALAGAFKLGAYLWDREMAVIRVSEHHNKFFIENLVCILAEERVALTVFRPQAFIKIDFDSAPPES